MDERVKVEVKKPEVKRENVNSRMQGGENSRSMDTGIERILYLQRTAGNQAVQRLVRSGMLQAKLRIGQPGDNYEQKADQVAEHVMRMPEPQVVSSNTPRIQRAYPACKEYELRREPVKEEEEEELKRKETSCQTPQVTPEVENSINSMRGRGQPLPEHVRSYFEPRFGADFSGVRIHNGSDVAETAKSINARAFTIGNNIAFGRGQFALDSHEGRRLMAHELTHVVQQDGDQGQQTRTLMQAKEAAKSGAPSQLEKVHLNHLDISIQRETPPGHLDSLNEMLDRIDVPEEEVISLLPQLTSSEKTTVTTDPSYKNRMASAFNTGEMVRAVNILNLPLDKKLEWVETATSASNINYSEIKNLITSAAQPERDTLKTTVWRDFFVGVCDNSTIITAVTDLQFDLKTQLEWIGEEASPRNLEYSQIQSLITSASQTDRDLLKTTVWRDFFVGVCDNSTIITAVTDLQFDLKTQLEWIGEEASPRNLEYSQIQSLITSASQTDRDLLKTTGWRDFFVGVCDNSTIKNALDDLNFDFLTTIQWLLEEASAYNIDYTWLCNKFKSVQPFPAGEDIVACTIMERDIRDGNFDTSPDHRPAEWAARAHNQVLAATQMGGLVGQTAKWRGSGPGSGTTFEIWASAATQDATPSLGPATIINCWEMILYAAFQSGVLSWTRIHDLYTTGLHSDWYSFLVNQLSFSNRIEYDPSSPGRARPVTGDIVFFDGSNHVALATGTIDGMGRTEIYSFWPPPEPFNITAPGLATVDQVKRTTIEKLNDYWVGCGHSAFYIEFATPNW